MLTREAANTVYRHGVDEAIHRSAFFFRDEVPAILESTFTPAQAERIRCPVLVAEGDASALSGPLSQQITALATKLLPQAIFMRVAGTNHMMPLQAPDPVGRLIRDFVREHS